MSPDQGIFMSTPSIQDSLSTAAHMDCGMISIWHSPTLSPTSLGSLSILILPRITTYLSLYGSPFSNDIKATPPLQNGRPSCCQGEKSNSNCWLLALVLYHNSLALSMGQQFSTFYVPALSSSSKTLEVEGEEARRRGMSHRRDDQVPRCRDKSTTQKIIDLDARIDVINTGTSVSVTVDALTRQTEPLFTKRILRTRVSSRFKLPTQLRKETESLKDYMKQFNLAVLKVQDPSDKVVVMAMMEGLRLGPLFDSLLKNVLETLSTLQSKVDKYIAVEELADAKQRRRGRDEKRKEPNTRRTDYRDKVRNKRPNQDSRRQTNDRRPHTLAESL
ncbi:hypothetical protein Acr_10g0010350 [Actinidia rufa]|uniref:Retrotransposon gag domain-containing protein n=1 Tax=Actinidia rufa TaxID=165716 RepID=A0A7J0FAD2_9ERIC|nr:hypothetical protein Acr_10g0010350 [Actinidia rufa]